MQLTYKCTINLQSYPTTFHNHYKEKSTSNKHVLSIQRGMKNPTPPTCNMLTGITYNRMFCKTPVTPMFTFLISPLPHLLLMLQLLHKMINVSCLPFLFLLQLFLLFLQSTTNKHYIWIHLNWKIKSEVNALIEIQTFLSDSFPLVAIGGGIKDGTYLQRKINDKFSL